MVMQLNPKSAADLFELADIVNGSGDRWLASLCDGVRIDRFSNDIVASTSFKLWQQNGCGHTACRGHHALFVCERPIEEYQQEQAKAAFYARSVKRAGRPFKYVTEEECKSADREHSRRWKAAKREANRKAACGSAGRIPAVRPSMLVATSMRTAGVSAMLASLGLA